eukprot:TRINITY_DN13257_c0_g1_i1.p1 TRINITY_DN13257_c0_g1~~TRINITY_DN13257_c0_g1_i1.p1  ORF type:complete len:477 (-),score=117.59 TRINITY_DN13257_c0_g1_i1:129-1559(-)
MGPKNPRVYFDISIGNRTGGRVVIELFADVTPRTAENFRGLCTGEYGTGRTTKKRLCYEGCQIFRSVKGFMIQSGDFQFNNGDGGESIYGGTFNDEDFSRRHTQAGILSMANKGRNSNGSQFFITLKRAQQLDNKHIAFGQVVEGMDVIRAVSQVPVDRDDKPRVSCSIVGCGELGVKSKRKGDDLHDEQGSAISGLFNEANDVQKVNSANQGKLILGGKEGGAKIDDSATSSSSSSDKKSFEEEGGGAAYPPPKNDRERRLMELRLKMNAGRAANGKEVIEEQKRESDPDYLKKKDKREKRALEEDEKGKEDEDILGGGKSKPGGVPKGKDYLNDTIEAHDAKMAKKKKGNPDAFGWDVFNQDSLYRAHEKRLKHLKFDAEAYKTQAEEIEAQGDSLQFAGWGFKDTDDGKERLAAAMDLSDKKKKEFSRRRAYNDEEDRNYVNDRNRVFNKKMDRFFNSYTEETRQNLERGTAL